MLSLQSLSMYKRKWENWTMTEIEKFPCNNFKEACARERYWKDLLNAQLNKVVPNRTDKEYREDNKEQLSIKLKKYYAENKLMYAQKGKVYRNQNEEKLKERSRQYRENNKEAIQAKKSEVYICECGINYTSCHRTRHLRTLRHQKYIENQKVN
jgi:hypothetical protein